MVLLLSACAEQANEGTSPAPDDTTPGISEPDTGSTEQPAADENDASSPATPGAEDEPADYAWMAPEMEHLGYEEFFAAERTYRDPETPGYRYTRVLGVGQFWSVGEGDSYTPYIFMADEDGFFICEFNNEENVLHRVPNTADLADSTLFTSNTRQIYCFHGGELLCVDVLTGERTVIYAAGRVVDQVLCYSDVLYFLAIEGDTLSLLRFYHPTMTLLYRQPALDIPDSWYDLHRPDSNLSPVTWETIHPAFWDAIQPLLDDPSLLTNEQISPTIFNREYLTAHPLSNEAIRFCFMHLQPELNLRPRLLGIYDPVTDTYSEQYGIYDICYFGTGIDGHEHFSDDPEVE